MDYQVIRLCCLHLYLLLHIPYKVAQSASSRLLILIAEVILTEYVITPRILHNSPHAIHSRLNCGCHIHFLTDSFCHEMWIYHAVVLLDS